MVGAITHRENNHKVLLRYRPGAPGQSSSRWDIATPAGRYVSHQFPQHCRNTASKPLTTICHRCCFYCACTTWKNQLGSGTNDWSHYSNRYDRLSGYFYDISRCYGHSAHACIDSDANCCDINGANLRKVSFRLCKVTSDVIYGAVLATISANGTKTFLIKLAFLVFFPFSNYYD